MARAITVKFLSATNSSPARMRVYSWFTQPKTVHFPAVCNFDASDIEACAGYAAGVALDEINEQCSKHGVVWALDQYIETYDGDRHFSLK